MSAINLNIRDFEAANLSECEFLDEASNIQNYINNNFIPLHK